MQSREQMNKQRENRKLEREMKRGLMTSRRTIMEREKAMEAARNPGFSKFGDCLVNINSKTDKALTSNMRKLNSEIRRMEAQVKHKMRHFVQTSAVMNHEPLILVERPASPDVIKRAHTMTSYNPLIDEPPDLGDENKPGYMRSIRSKAKTPSTLTTIDAFSVKARKKKNVWEDAAFDKSKIEFQSTIRPYAKLTQREKTDLQRGYEFHKPKLEQISHDTDENHGKKTPKKKIKNYIADDSDDSDLDEITPFITQMAAVRQSKTKRKDKTLAEIRVKSDSPILAIAAANAPSNHTLNKDRNVRFSSQVVASAPTRRKQKQKQKTKATPIMY